MYKHRSKESNNKKSIKQKSILITACILALTVSLLAVFGVFSFIFNGLDYVLNNEDKYQVVCERIDEEICLSLGNDNQPVKVRNCEISVEYDANKNDDNLWDILFHMKIRNRIGFLNGYMVSPYEIFESACADAAQCEVYVKLDGEWHKLKMRGMGGGGNTQISHYSFGLGSMIEFSGNPDGIELKLVGFRYSKYKRK